MRCQIHYINSESAPELNSDLIQTVIDEVLASDNLEQQQINILFVDAKESDRLHREFFNINGETDVMSFPDGALDEETGLIHLGDLAVCIDVAQQCAHERHRHYTDEIILYITHGLLHLLGYDDQNEHDRQEMWDLQRHYLQLVNITIDATPDH